MLNSQQKTIDYFYWNQSDILYLIFWYCALFLWECKSWVLFYVSRGKRLSRRESQGTVQSSETVEAMGQIKAVEWCPILHLRRSNDKVYTPPVHSPWFTVQWSLAWHPWCGWTSTPRKNVDFGYTKIFWVGLKSDIQDYVICCHRCIVSNTPEPEGSL